MDNIRIRSCFMQDVTVISNDFLDRYLADANGEFVKVYLLLLRSAGRRDDSLSLSGIADSLNCTENDVRRALRYWEKQGVLSLTFGPDEELSEVAFGGYCNAEPRRSALSKAEPASDGTFSEERKPEGLTMPEETAPDYGKPSDITSDRLAELGQYDEIRELFFVAQQYIGRPLKRGEMQSIAFFYDTLKFSPSLIDYLIEYCVERKHSSFRYIEKVALNWKEQGITTVLEAKNASGSYHREYYDILKALGINNHHPIEAETAVMRKWIEEQNFPMEIIQEACTRTVMSAAKPSLSYVDGILTRWFNRGVKTMEDIRKLDEEHARKAAPSNKSANAAPAKKNAFTNFDQRTYDYAALENEILKQN